MIPRSPTDQSRSLTLPCPCPVRQASEMENRKSYHRLSVLSSCLHRFLSSVFPPHTQIGPNTRHQSPARLTERATVSLPTLDSGGSSADGSGSWPTRAKRRVLFVVVNRPPPTPLFFLFQQPRHSTNFLRYVGPIVDGCISELPLPLVDKFREGTT